MSAVGQALTAVRDAPTILTGMRLMPEVACAALEDDPAAVTVELAAALGERDRLVAVAAVHALATLAHPTAERTVATVLAGGDPHLREHATWRLAWRAPWPSGMPALADLTAEGGFAGMLAQRTLETWARTDPVAVGAAVRRVLAGTADVDARGRLVETLGLAADPVGLEVLRRVAADRRESRPARAAAVEALVELAAPGAAGLAEELSPDDVIGDVARLARADLARLDTVRPVRHGRPEPGPSPESSGLTVAQVFLHADLDRELTHAGQGDNGGIATLLVHLGDALLSSVDRVVTVSRGTHAAALSASPPDRHAFLPVPFAVPPVHAHEAWPRWVAARRGIRRAFDLADPVDVVHLRMADVGALVAGEVARERGIPVVLTLAPDPHTLIAARERTGELTRATFAAADLAEHLCFRERLLADLAAHAAHVVLFPRAEPEREACELLGIDLVAQPERFTTVAEGLDLGAVDRAATPPADATELTELDRLLATLPQERRSLPLAVSVGRLHRVKGMATLVEAWHGHLTDRCNLLVVGGDLDDPTDEEAEQLALIDAVVARSAGPEAGLLLAGHRRNGTVALWLVAARNGRAGLAAPGGVYVCASLKEEFGIAILEAMATGLVVVAPDGGGPATYVEEGRTGMLARTGSATELARAVATALDLAASPDAADRAAEARQLVRERYGIETMAAALSDVYTRAVHRGAS